MGRFILPNVGEYSYNFLILRVGVAITILAKIFAEFPYIETLYTDKGILQSVITVAFENHYTISIQKLCRWLNIVDQTKFIQTIYFVFGIAAISLFIGFLPRIAASISFLIHLLLINGYNLLAFGFDSFLFILLFYCVIFPLKKYQLHKANLSVHTPILGLKQERIYILVLQIHLSIVYFAAGISKLKGNEWLSGMAVWNAISQPQFITFFTPVFKRLFSNIFFAKIFSWMTLILESGFPILILIKKFRIQKILVLGIMLMHLFIALVMGLHLFALIMIVFDLTCFVHFFLPVHSSHLQDQDASNWPIM